MKIIGHRGARGEAPENTLGGFQYLRDLGVRAVEFDVRQLKDNCLTVIHDDNFLRTAGLPHPLYECVDGDLVHYDHRHQWANWPKTENTPKLQQVLSLLNDFEHIEVEIKPVTTLPEAEKLTLSLEQQLEGLEQQVTITSFDEKVLSSLQQQRSRFKRGLLVEDDIKSKAIEKAHHLGCSHIGWMDQLATPEMIQLSHLAQLNISVWTVNSIERAKALRDAGVQGLITDIPKTMQSQL
ncbi:MAG TPA: glycerophosphodiester phosphodiesterase [Acinetobacter radioresistens]|nr:glycerophosphodiester phosphodiesterase [Acinetobacter radioresistens]